MQIFKTYKDYRKAWVLADKKTPSIPLNIDIELSAVCNLKCPFCYVPTSKIKTKNKFFDFGLFKKIIDEADHIGVPAIKFNWRGEPTLHPEFNRFLIYAMKYNFYDRIVNTNGNYRLKTNFGLMTTTKVIFSLDTFDTEIYLKMRKGGNHKLIMKNIDELLKLGHKGVIVKRLITELNKEEYFLLKCKSIWGKDIEVKETFCFDRGSDKMQVDKNENMERIYCGYPSQRLVIGVGGDVHVCCVDYKDELPIGNIKAMTLKKIWDNEKIKNLRMELKQGKFRFNPCKICTSYISYNCENRKRLIGNL